MSLFTKENTVALELSDGSLVLVIVDAEIENTKIVLSYSFDENTYENLSDELRDELQEKMKELHDKIAGSLVNTILGDLEATQNKST